VGYGWCVRILIADDHEVVRRGLRALVEARPGWAVCGEAGDGVEAVEKAVALAPDVVVLDVGMPRLGGLEAARRIQAAAPRTLLVVLSNHHDEELVRGLLGAGARAYVLKSDAADDLVTAIESVCGGRLFFSPQIAGLVLDGYLGRARPTPAGAAGGRTAPLDRLTAREREVLQLLGEGQSTKEVASALGVSVKTAESHRANVMKKLALRSIGELVRYAVRNHVVDL